MHFFRWSSVLLASVLLVACGGGGGGDKEGGTTSALSAPANLTATGGDSRASLSWGAVAGASGYNIYQGTTPGGEGATAVQSVTTTSAAVTGLVNGTTYYFVVKATKGSEVGPASNEVSVVPSPTTALQITQLELAQTHAVPEGGLSWTLANAKETLHAIGGREALAVMKLSSSDGNGVQLEGWLNGAQLGSVAVAAPGALPPTEAAGPAFAADRYSATLPAAWLKPGLQLRVRASNYLPGAFRSPVIGADSKMTVRLLPFYLYGATEANTFPLTQTGTPPADAVTEMFAKWPTATVVAQNHPAKRVLWPTMSIGPREGGAAYLTRSRDDQKDGYATMAAVLSVLSGLRGANGEAEGSHQYYAPLIMLTAAGTYGSPGGGLGGGDVGTGDSSYSGVFIHEQGHALGMPHQGDAYTGGKYPYAGGSLAGSVWGYDSTRKQFLGTFVPTTASSYKTCAGSSRQMDAQNRCVKQDPMQGGAGDQAQGFRFATFSDYSTAMMQRHLEGVTSVDSNGAHVYSGGAVVHDTTFTGGYRRWDTIDRRWVAFTPKTTDNALYGFNGGFPIQRDVPVHSIVIAYSYVGPAEVSQIYPVLSYTGNLRQYIDPTDATQRASITPNTGPNAWYCHGSGCDYTLRVTYTNGTVRHVLIQSGFRSWFSPTGPIAASASDPLNGNSFRTWVINVPGSVALSKVELLDTPKGWEGVPANPTVLLSRQVGSAGVMAAASIAEPEPVCAEPLMVVVPASAAPPPRCPKAQRPPPSREKPRDSWRR